MSALIQKLNTSTGKWEASELIEDDLPDGIGSGSQLDIAEKTLYVSPTFTTEGQFYDNIKDAITDADADGNAHTIIVYRGVYSGNFDLGIHSMYCYNGVEIRPFNTAFPALTLGGGDLLGYAIITDNGVTTTDYLVEVQEDAKIEAKEIYADYGAINLSGFTGGLGRYIEIKADRIAEISYDSTVAPVYLDIEVGFLNDLEVDGHTDATFNIHAKEFLGLAKIYSSKVFFEAQQILTEDTRVIEVDGGNAIIKGRLENYDEVTNAASGLGYPLIIGSGSLRLIDFQAKNASGGIIFSFVDELKMMNCVFESGSVGGGSADETIESSVTIEPMYLTRTAQNSNNGALVNAWTGGNRVVSSKVEI